ncbi:MAG: porin [Bacteroidia bacterium]|nr:porin [Bacteroidia bacterium]
MKLHRMVLLVLWMPLAGQAQRALLVGKQHAAEFNTTLNAWALIPGDGQAPLLQLRDLRLGIEGTRSGKWEYKFQLDAANFFNDSLRNAVIDAHITLDLPDQFDIIAGYQLLPFSRNSIIGFRHSPFYQRSLLSDNTLFSRRDLGITLRKQAHFDHLAGYLGVYQGTGRILPELGRNAGISVAARGEFAFPVRFRHEEIDLRISPMPRGVIGVNVLGSTHRRDSVRFLQPFMTRGAKWLAGIDAAFCYRGLSLQAEMLWAIVRPRPAQQTLGDIPLNYETAGGYLSGNYYFKALNSLLAFRYERFAAMPLPESRQAASARAAWNFLISNDLKRMLRVEYCFYSQGGWSSPDPALRRGLRAGLQVSL